MQHYYDFFCIQMKRQLGGIEKWFDIATAYAQSKSFDPNLFLGFRLAPDQFPFSGQVQLTCDTAKNGSSRLTGREAPNHPDTEQTLDELRTRIRSTIAYLDGFKPEDFKDGPTRIVRHPRWKSEGKIMIGADYFIEHAVPNFFFHLTNVYAILRHNGVNLGKRDFLGAYALRPDPEL